ncbi:MAG: 13E12 repeat family protein, partial [Actinobacteria bacterium]|nr:13E12 repeat family protein [Actinomycetota bacterium]
MGSADTMRAYGPASDTATPVPDLDALDRQLAALATTDPLLIHPDELPEGLKRIQRATNVLGTVRARWIAASETRNSSGAERHSKWLSGQLGVDGDVAAKDAAVAKTVEAHEPVAEAAEAGEISPDHVRVIGRAAGTVEDEQADALVDELVAYAREHTPEQTARLARRRAMQQSKDRGQSTAQDQLARRRFRFVERRDGMIHGEGLFTPEVANQLQSALEPLTGPDGDDVPEDQRRSYPQRLHDALGELADIAMGTPGFPHSRGLPTQAMII